MGIKIKPTDANPKEFFDSLVYFYNPNGQGGLCDSAQEFSELRLILKNMSSDLYRDVISAFLVTDENVDAFHHLFLDIVSVGNEPIVDAFLSNTKLNIHYNRARGVYKTALQCASHHEHENLVTRFIALGADFADVDAGSTSFMWAIRRGFVNIVVAFLKGKTFHELTTINHESYDALSGLYDALAALNASNGIKASKKAEIDGVLEVAIKNPNIKFDQFLHAQIQIETVEQAIELAIKTDSRPVFHGMASLSMREGRLPKINERIELMSDTTHFTMHASVIAPYRLERARILWSIGKYDEAIRDYDYVLESAFSDNAQLQREKKCVLQLQSKPTEAELLTLSGLFKNHIASSKILSGAHNSGFRVDISTPSTTASRL